MYSVCCDVDLQYQWSKVVELNETIECDVCRVMVGGRISLEDMLVMPYSTKYL